MLPNDRDLNMKRNSTPSHRPISDSPRIVIIGAGVSGICMGIQLLRNGYRDFRIIEMSDDVGGTWFDNTYPGCGCDIPSMLYSFSFALNGNWSRKYAPQDEILHYFRKCVDRFSLRDHIQFQSAVERAEWHDGDKQWKVVLKTGEVIQCNILISAVGQLSRPRLPEIEGIDSFNGPLFHSARWDHTFSPEGKRVGVVGNGASAIQLIPELAKQAEQVAVFQRSPNWILHRHDHKYPWLWRQLNRLLPGFARFQRWIMYLFFELRILCYNRRTLMNRAFTGWRRRRMQRVVPSHLRDQLIPTYPAGCKRVLLSNNFLQCLHQSNVELITDPIASITDSGIQTDSQEIPLDAIVMSTGFEANRFLYPMDIIGSGGRTLDDVWSRRPKTVLGLIAPEFPNFFMLYGPNTNLGHNSIIFMVECQVRYILEMLSLLDRTESDAFEATEEATSRFDTMLQSELKKKVWSGYAGSWYKNASGDITNNWCRSTLAYFWQTRRVDKSSIRLSTRQCSTAAASTPIAR